MDDRTITPGVYRHFKGALYDVIGIAEDRDTGKEFVVYRQKYGEYKLYVRLLSEFSSEVDHEKYPDVKQKYRFEQLIKRPVH